MIKLNVNESKELKFNVSVSGMDPRDLTGSLKLIMEDIEYGFQIRMVDGSVVAKIPPLNTFIKKNLSEGQVISARLDIVADGTLIVPWKDAIRIETPVTVEATMSEIITVDEEMKPNVKINSIIEKSKLRKTENKVLKEDKLSKEKSLFRKSLEKK